jgi:hypothetical protein
METLLQKVKPIMEEQSGVKLTETYSYARIYKKGDELKRHKDRYSCEISTTMNLGGDDWSIFLEPSGEEGKDGIEVKLEAGDMLMYRGCDLEHWRTPFEGEDCGTGFCTTTMKAAKMPKQNKYDGRPMIGLPAYFKGV